MRRTVALVAAAGLLIVIALVFLQPTRPPACGPSRSSLGNAPEVDVPFTPAPVTNRNAPLTAKIATWNTYLGNSTGRVVAGLEALTGVSDVIGAQELFSAEPPGDGRAGDGAEGLGASTGADSAVPIFYNASKYKLLAHDVVKEFDVERIENGPSGTSIGPAGSSGSSSKTAPRGRCSSW